ncbi:DUF1007 family protein [Ruegeria sp.]|uniref:DUF1007 family protein n=1 Tax=Ruegeria sp. TaxID=1879320 RepID=UPI003B5A78AC
MIQKLLAVALISLSLLLQTRAAMTHPHVFVDARIDVGVDRRGMLQVIHVTWRFDQFHTLYILSFDGITPTEDGHLNPSDQEALSASYTDWQGGFNGFAKLLIDGALVALEPPSAVSARLQNDQLEISFSRVLSSPANLTDAKAEIEIYDATYYHDIAMAASPRILGDAQGCHASLLPFDPDSLTASAETALAELEKEQSSTVEDVGRLFADRITLSCE